MGGQRGKRAQVVLMRGIEWCGGGIYEEIERETQRERDA